MNLFAFAGLSCAIFCLILGLISFYFGNKKIHKILAFFNVVVGVWGAGGFLVGIADNSDAAILGWKVAHLGGMFVSILFLHLVYVFCRINRTKLIIFGYSQAVIFNLLSFFTDKFINKTRNVYNLYYNDVSPLFALAVLVYIFLVFLSFLELLKFFKHSSGRERTQVLYIIFGFLFGFLGGTSTFLPEFRIDIFYPFGNLGIVFYCIVVTYSILKYRILDIKVAFTRGAILLIVYAFIVGIPIAILILGKPLLVKYFQTLWFVPPLGLYTILALLGPYIYLRFQNKAEEKRMKQQVRLHQSLKAASKTTIEVQSVDKLSKIIPRYLLKLYKKLDNEIMHISMFLHDKDTKVYHMQSSVGEQKIPVDTLIQENSMLVKWFTVIRARLVDDGVCLSEASTSPLYDTIDYWLNNPDVLRKPFKGLGKILKELKRIMESYNASLILPSVYQKELLGFLMLGEKNPDPYSVSDISTFSILANDSAMAFKAAQLFEDLKIAQASLIQSEKLNLLGQLASSMAHEINNPLAIISGNAQLLLMDETDDGKKKFLQKISDQTERGYKIIHRLLNFSRLPKEEIKIIKVHEMIDETLELIGHKIKHGNIELIKEYNEVPDINGNPTQIQEVLLNLFVNGIQSMGEGGTLKIATTVVRHKVEILIADTGKGIDEKDVQNIFDPFYTKGKENGTGLGLFVASQVMGLHKGTINVKSKVGQGTIFMLQFSIEKD